MTRFSPFLKKTSLKHSKLLYFLVKSSKNISSSKSELNWIKQELPKNKWLDAVIRRSKYEPLQYILKSQPFGSIDIICQKNVLIPRSETEEWTLKIINLIKNYYKNETINIIDSCSGSGCILLLLNHELKNINKLLYKIVGFDISLSAYKLSVKNLQNYNKIYNETSENCKFLNLDLFDLNLADKLKFFNRCDLILCNPPYISEKCYNKLLFFNGIEKSVKKYEPKLALVENKNFYDVLIKNLVLKVNANGFLFEIGNQKQAKHVELIIQSNSLNWVTGRYYDNSKKLRCILGWKKNSNMEILNQICSIT